MIKSQLALALALCHCGGATGARSTAPQVAKCSAQPTKVVDSSVLFPPSDTLLGTGLDALAVTPDVLVVAVGFQVIMQRAANPNCPIPQPGMGLAPGCITTTCNVGRLFSVPIRGGTPTLLVDNVPGFVAGLAVTSTRIVYGAAGVVTNGDHEGAILSIPITGGSPTALVTGVRTAWTGGLATDGQNVFWPDNDGIHRVPLTGGTSQTLSTASMAMVRPLGGTLLLDDDNGGQVLSMPIGGGPTMSLATHQVNPVGAQDCGSGNICWSDEGALSGPGSINAQGAPIMRLEPTGQLDVLLSPGIRSGVIFDGQQDLFALAGDCCGGVIIRIPLDGRAAATIATTSGGGPFAVDDECVYWGDTIAISSEDKNVRGM